MKNLKKLLAVIVTVALLATFAVPVLADDMSDSDICTTLGMLQGSGDGVTAEYLASTPTRIQAAIMFLRLKGLEDEALAYEGEANFEDAGLVWAEGQNILAYLLANPDLGWQGNPAGVLFDPLGEIDAVSYYKVLLTALGYVYNVDFAWGNVLPFAASVGLLAVADADPFTVADLTTATVEALQANVAGTNQTLIEKLVEDGNVDGTVAETTGIYAAPVVDPFAVTGAAGTNLVEIVVDFNYEVDAATVVVGNFTIGGFDAAAVALSADKKSVTVTVPAIGAQAVSYALVVKSAVKSAAGEALAANYSQTVTIIDATLPVVLSATITGPTSFELLFSEPIKTAGTVLVNNGVYGAAAVAPVGNKVTVNLGAALAEGDYTITVAGYGDHAGFVMNTTNVTLAYVKDTTPVTASIVSATQTVVKVLFNKATATVLDADYFYHTFTAYKPDGVATTDNKTYTLTFTVNPIPEGTANVTVLKTDGLTAVADAWGNVMAENAVLPVTVAADKTAPTVALKEVVSEQLVQVEYSELVVGGALVANYEVKDAAGNVKAVNAVTDEGNNIFQFGFAAKLPGGTYTVTISNITDAALAPNAMPAATLSFTITDLTPPTVTGATYVDSTAGVDYIYVTFGEAVATSGAGSAVDTANYRLGGAVLPAGTTIATFGSTSKVQITLPAGTNVKQALSCGQIADLAGNKMVALQTPIATVAETAPLITSVTTKGLNTLEIVVDKILTSVVADGLTISGATYSPAYVSYTTADGTTIITATLRVESKLANAGSQPTDVRVVADKLKSDTGLFMAAATYNDAAIIKDGIAPTAGALANTATNVFTITFDENVQAAGPGTTAALDLVIVNAGGNTLVALTDYTTTVAGGVVTVTLTGAGYAGKLTVSSAAAINYIKDASTEAVKMNAFSGKEVTMAIIP